MTLRFECEDRNFLITRDDVLQRAPGLYRSLPKGKSDHKMGRDPEAFEAVMRYCASGIVAHTDSCYAAEFRFWGIIPELETVWKMDSEVEKSILADTATFLQRLPRRPIVSSTFEPNPIREHILPCTHFIDCDRWHKRVDAYKYAVAYPEVLRTVAFIKFGMQIKCEVFSDKIIKMGHSITTLTGEEVLFRKDWSAAGIICKECIMPKLVICPRETREIVYQETSFAFSMQQVGKNMELHADVDPALDEHLVAYIWFLCTPESREKWAETVVNRSNLSPRRLTSIFKNDTNIVALEPVYLHDGCIATQEEVVGSYGLVIYKCDRVAPATADTSTDLALLGRLIEYPHTRMCRITLKVIY